MEIYFKNDGSYGKAAIGIPVIVDEKPIGFVQDVCPDRVICRLWGRFVGREQIMLNVGMEEQDIRSIYICVKG